jgi:hypothetical protein
MRLTNITSLIVSIAALAASGLGKIMGVSKIELIHIHDDFCVDPEVVCGVHVAYKKNAAGRIHGVLVSYEMPGEQLGSKWIEFPDEAAAYQAARYIVDRVNAARWAPLIWR